MLAGHQDPENRDAPDSTKTFQLGTGGLGVGRACLRMRSRGDSGQITQGSGNQSCFF